MNQITARKPYPAYKPSGVEWLGDVPKDWQGKKLKFVAAVELSNVDKHTVEGEQSAQALVDGIKILHCY